MPQEIHESAAFNSRNREVAIHCVFSSGDNTLSGCLQYRISYYRLFRLGFSVFVRRKPRYAFELAVEASLASEAAFEGDIYYRSCGVLEKIAHHSGVAGLGHLRITERSVEKPKPVD